MRKRRAFLYTIFSLLAAVTAALTAFRTAGLFSSLRDNPQMKIFTEGFYLSDTVFRISIPVFILISASVLFLMRGKKSVIFAPPEKSAERVCALVCCVALLLSGAVSAAVCFSELGAGMSLLLLVRLVCALLAFPCAVYFFRVFRGSVQKGNTWIFALAAPLWATILIVAEYFGRYFAFNNPVRVSGNVALACVITAMLFEVRSVIAYPCGKFFAAIISALPCLVFVHVLPLVFTFPLWIGGASAEELINDIALLPIAVYMALRNVRAIAALAENN